MTRFWTSINPRLRIAAAVGIILIVLPVAWYLVSPLFINVTVDERFPDIAPIVAPTSMPAAMAAPTAAVAMAAATAMPAAMAAPTAEVAMAAATAIPAPMAAPTAEVAMAAATAIPAAMAEPTAAASAPTARPAATVEPTVAAAAIDAPTAAPAVPAPLSSGQFTDVDTIHTGEGTATVYQLPDNRRILRFESFKVQNGPDLYVYLSGHPMPRSSAELHDQGAFEVAVLKGNIGNQNYELPADLDLAQYRSVVIYCKRFSHIFSTAELLAPQL